MRRLPVRNLPDRIQRFMEARARLDPVRDEEAMIDLLREMDFERAMERELAMKQLWEDEVAEFEPCGGHCDCDSAFDDLDVDDPP